MTKRRAPAKRHRSAKHGGYVSAAEAAASPETTVAETVRPRPQRDESLRARVEELRAEAELAVSVHAASVSCEPALMLALCEAWQE